MAITYSGQAQTLRAELKAAGFNARRVTVRQNHSTLYVTIRDAWTSLTQVKAIADKFEVVRRCEADRDRVPRCERFDERHRLGLGGPLVMAYVGQTRARAARSPRDRVVRRAR